MEKKRDLNPNNSNLLPKKMETKFVFYMKKMQLELFIPKQMGKKR